MADPRSGKPPVMAIIAELRDGTTLRLLPTRYPGISYGSGYVFMDTRGLVMDSMRGYHWVPADDPIRKAPAKHNKGART